MFSVPAQMYDRHAGRYSPELAAQLIDFAGIEPGMHVLDVGCGPGPLSRALADHGCTVTAVDPSEPFVEAATARVPEAEVMLASAESLPFPDDLFDAVVSQLVINFMNDAEAGAREMARVGRGTVAGAVWDYAGQMTLMRAFWDAALEVEPERAAAMNESATMRWVEEGQLADLFRGAGLTDVRAGELWAEAAYDDFEDLWLPLPAGVGPAGAFTVALDDTGRAALHDTFKRRLGVDDGPFQLRARAWAAAGVAP